MITINPIRYLYNRADIRIFGTEIMSDNQKFLFSHDL